MADTRTEPALVFSRSYTARKQFTQLFPDTLLKNELHRTPGVAADNGSLMAPGTSSYAQS